MPSSRAASAKYRANGPSVLSGGGAAGPRWSTYSGRTARSAPRAAASPSRSRATWRSASRSARELSWQTATFMRPSLVSGRDQDEGRRGQAEAGDLDGAYPLAVDGEREQDGGDGVERGERRDDAQ